MKLNFAKEELERRISGDYRIKEDWLSLYTELGRLKAALENIAAPGCEENPARGDCRPDWPCPPCYAKQILYEKEEKK